MKQKPAESSGIIQFAFRNARLLAMLAGSFIISIWTMVRFFSKSSNFDLVGQQVLAHQWLTGLHGGAIIGPTNYILKIFVLYMPLDMIHVSQRGKLVFMTLLVNVVTYILMILLLEKVWRLFYSRIPKSFYTAMLWLALAAGSVFWIQFTNSRNIEVVGGLLLVYLMLRLLKAAPTIKLSMLLVLVASILFFADPLQVYMTAIPALAYVFVLFFADRSNQKFSRVLLILGALTVGFVMSKCIALGIESIFKTNFLVVANQRTGSLFATLIDSAIPLSKQTARLYVAGYELGRFVEALNLLFVLGIGVLGVWYVWKRIIPRKLGLLVGLFWITDALVYMASGQALQSGTSRYLIMTVPFFVLFAAAVVSAKTKHKPVILLATIILLCVNSGALVYAFTQSWNPQFTKDAHSYAVITYMKDHSFTHGYASMDAALPVNYLTSGSVRLLPVKCEAGNTIQPAFLFFDKTYYENIMSASADSEVPLILDGDQIANSPNVCTKEDIRASLGNWQAQDKLRDGSDVLLYDAGQIRQSIQH